MRIFERTVFHFLAGPFPIPIQPVCDVRLPVFLNVGFGYCKLEPILELLFHRLKVRLPSTLWPVVGLQTLVDESSAEPIARANGTVAVLRPIVSCRHYSVTPGSTRTSHWTIPFRTLLWVQNPKRLIACKSKYVMVPQNLPREPASRHTGLSWVAISRPGSVGPLYAQ